MIVHKAQTDKETSEAEWKQEAAADLGVTKAATTVSILIYVSVINATLGGLKVSPVGKWIIKKNTLAW